MKPKRARNGADQYSMSIKLTVDEFAALERRRAQVHEQVGVWVSPTALVRSWITDQLGDEQPKRRRTRATTEE